MPKMKLAYTLATSAAVLTAVLAASALQPAEAQQRKSLRWTTSQVGSYGYTIAASMAKVVEQAAKEAGSPIKVAGFVRYALGEGIEKKQEDFAAEVAAQVKG